MTKRFSIDEVRAIINSIPSHRHGIPPSFAEQDLAGNRQGGSGPKGAEYVDKVELIKRFEQAK